MLEKSLPVPQGNTAPSKQVNKCTRINRNPNVVAWILKNSGGICESCNKPAPFKKSNGEFYLEVHHLKRLADGGSDTVTNSIAVCPNCHRGLHYADDRDHILSILYKLGT